MTRRRSPQQADLLAETAGDFVCVGDALFGWPLTILMISKRIDVV